MVKRKRTRLACAKIHFTGHRCILLLAQETDSSPEQRKAIRPLALGRKNYLFAGNHAAAANIANYYTIFGTCKKLGVNPYNYMLWCLQRINGTSIQAIHSISPMSYKKLLEKEGT